MFSSYRYTLLNVAIYTIYVSSALLVIDCSIFVKFWVRKLSRA